MSEEIQAAQSAPTDLEESPLPSEDTKPPDLPWFIPADEDRGVYRFVLAAAKRARQLQGGARPVISTTSRKPTRIAMEEIRSSAIEVEILPEDWVEPEPVMPVEAAQAEAEALFAPPSPQVVEPEPFK